MECCVNFASAWLRTKFPRLTKSLLITNVMKGPANHPELSLTYSLDQEMDCCLFDEKVTSSPSHSENKPQLNHEHPSSFSEMILDESGTNFLASDSFEEQSEVMNSFDSSFEAEFCRTPRDQLQVSKQERMTPVREDDSPELYGCFALSQSQSFDDDDATLDDLSCFQPPQTFIYPPSSFWPAEDGSSPPHHPARERAISELSLPPEGIFSGSSPTKHFSHVHLEKESSSLHESTTSTAALTFASSFQSDLSGSGATIMDVYHTDQAMVESMDGNSPMMNNSSKGIHQSLPFRPCTCTQCEQSSSPEPSSKKRCRAETLETLGELSVDDSSITIESSSPRRHKHLDTVSKRLFSDDTSPPSLEIMKQQQYQSQSLHQQLVNHLAPSISFRTTHYEDDDDEDSTIDSSSAANLLSLSKEQINDLSIPILREKVDTGALSR